MSPTSVNPTLRWLWAFCIVAANVSLCGRVLCSVWFLVSIFSWGNDDYYTGGSLYRWWSLASGLPGKMKRKKTKVYLGKLMEKWWFCLIDTSTGPDAATSMHLPWSCKAASCKYMLQGTFFLQYDKDIPISFYHLSTHTTAYNGKKLAQLWTACKSQPMDLLWMLKGQAPWSCPSSSICSLHCLLWSAAAIARETASGGLCNLVWIF